MALTKEQLKEIKYLNISTHTHFSIPMGVGKIKDHMKRAAECGFTGFAITDSSTMGGALEVINASKDKDFLKKINREKFPILLGVQLNMIDDLEKKDKVNKYFNISAYAINNKGYQNLVYLTSIGSKSDHFYHKPRISLPELIEFQEGLLVTSGDINGMIAQSILKETGQEELLVEIFKEHFEERFFFEIHFKDLSKTWNRETKEYVDQGFNPQKIVNLRLFELAKKFGVKCVLTQNSYMPEKKHKSLQDILIGNHPIGKDGWRFGNAYYTMSVEEMYAEVQKEAPYINDEMFKEFCENSQILLEKAKDLKLSFTPLLPDIKYEESVVNKSQEWEDKYQAIKEDLKTFYPPLAELFEIGEREIALKTSLKIIIKNEKMDFKNKVYVERLNMELRVIARNGIINLCDYFLLLEDVTHFVRENGYLRGFGRGSGAGSLVAYALDITDCNPIDFDLLFERFLTKERVGAINFEIPNFPMKEYGKKE